jgi:hypothetical protein
MDSLERLDQPGEPHAWPLRIIGLASLPFCAAIAVLAFLVMFVSPERAAARAAVQLHGGLRRALAWQVGRASVTMNRHPLLLVGVLAAGAIGGTLLGLIIGGKAFPWLGVLASPIGLVLAPGFGKAIVLRGKG